MSERTPFLLISDAISASTGFARIARNLATKASEHLSDIFRIATAGYAGPGSSKFDFPQYNLDGISNWVLPTLPEIWHDFAGDQRGIVMFIWDLSRLGWIGQPLYNDEMQGVERTLLREWLAKRPFDLWGYVPIDGSGPNDRLTFPVMRTALGFDRLLAYGPFGEGVLRRTIAEETSNRYVTNLPHGVDTDVFYETDRKLCRSMFLQLTGAQGIMHKAGPLADDEVLIGIVATNQDRKNWALGIQACAMLERERKVRIWIHTDALEKYWSIPALLVDYGILHRTVVSTGFLSDAKMSEAYSACDLCFGIAPEGFGLPNAEALACGTPVITGSYAGSADFVPAEMQVDPIAFYYQGEFSTCRPVYNPADWAVKATEWIGKRTALDPQYDWKNLWPKWEQWFREGASFSCPKP